MKQFKIIFALVSFLVSTNIVVAANQRTVANPDVNVEVRSAEDIVKNSADFVSVTPGDNTKKMSSRSSRVKQEPVAALATGIATAQTTDPEQLQSNKKDIVKKYNRFSKKQGVKKNKKTINSSSK